MFLSLFALSAVAFGVQDAQDRSGEATLKQILKSVASRTNVRYVVVRSVQFDPEETVGYDGNFSIIRRGPKEFRFDFASYWGDAFSIVMNGVRTRTETSSEFDDSIQITDKVKTVREAFGMVNAESLAGKFGLMLDGESALERFAGEKSSIVSRPYGLSRVLLTVKERGDSLEVLARREGKEWSVERLEFRHKMLPDDEFSFEAAYSREDVHTEELPTLPSWTFTIGGKQPSGKAARSFFLGR